MQTEAKRQRALLAAPPTEAAPGGQDAAVAAVFGNLDLLRKILLLLLDTPPELVRAALISKDWLEAASDRTFLRQFGARCPPRLLGFLASFRSAPGNPLLHDAVTRFVPLPHPPELAGAARLVAAAFDGSAKTMGLVVGCRNGRVLVKHGGHGGTSYSVRSPLSSSPSAMATVNRPSAFLPLQARDKMETGVGFAQLELLPYPGVDDPRRNALSGFGDFANFTITNDRTIQQAVYVQQRRGWAIHVSPPLQFPVPIYANHIPYSLLIGGRWLCMTTVIGWIIVLDLDTVTFSLISFPSGVSVTVAPDGHCLDHTLARAGDSGIYLVYVKGVELHLWFRRMDSGNAAVWERVETIHLPRVFRGHVARGFWNYVYAVANSMLENWDNKERDFYRVRIRAVGDDADFVFLTLGNIAGVFLLDVKMKTVKKVLQTSLVDDGGPLCGISAFMMPWPPVFPALKQNEGDDEDGDESTA